jgi:small neutral amino acid transporter SnatA (MarC family)
MSNHLAWIPAISLLFKTKNVNDLMYSSTHENIQIHKLLLPIESFSIKLLSQIGDDLIVEVSEAILINSITLLAVLNPPLQIPISGNLLREIKEERVACILQAVITALVILTLFACLGNAVLRFIGISINSFSVAGGALLFIIGVQIMTTGKTMSNGNNANDKYLFSWDEIPGNDAERFIEFLKKRFKIEWAKTENINKIEDGKTIIVSNKEKSLSLKLNNEKNKVNLKIDNVRVYEFTVKLEKKLNIYDTTVPKKGGCAVPIGTPFIAGPGAITVTTLMIQNDPLRLYIFPIVTIISIFVCLFVTTIVLYYSDNFLDLLTVEGSNVLARIMGIIIAAIGVEYVATGVLGLLAK